VSESGGGFHVRSASWEGDGEALRHVRFAVFVDEQKVPAEIEIDALDAVCAHALALDDTGCPIGTARLDDAGHIGRVAVLSAWRRRGVGLALMRHLMEHARQRGMTRIELSAQLQALPFYEAIGFVAEGEVYLEAGIEHRHMQLTLTS
jgi:predicted GNAT family N-acyltransferase